jgi:hypothetical protein
MLGGGKVLEDKVCEEKITHIIFRFGYEKGATVRYLFDSRLYDLIDYPEEIRSLYVCYMPKLSSGVMGLHASKCFLPPSEQEEFKEIVSKEIYFVPLFRYQIQDSIIRFHRMSHEERMKDTQVSSQRIYSEAEELSFFGSDPGKLRIFYQIYDVVYEYLNGMDTLQWLNDDKEWQIPRLSSIPMFYLPLNTTVYYRKNLKNYPVKKRLGFYGRRRSPEADRLADYRHELDTTLLALPIKIFQYSYLQTQDIYCLDEQEFPLTWTASFPEPSPSGKNNYHQNKAKKKS